METQKNIVISSSKDTFVKLWDLTTQHCFKTLTGHLGEVWDLVLIRNEEMLVTGGADSELRVWKLEWDKVEEENSSKKKLVVPKVPVVNNLDEDDVQKNEEEVAEDGSNLTVTRLGSILRKGEGRVGGLVVDKTGKVLVCHGNDNILEMFMICSQEEVDKRVAKRLKKEKKRTGEEVTGEGVATLQEMIRRIKEVKTGGKLRNADVLVTGTTVKSLVVLANNLVELVTLDLATSGAAPSIDLSLSQPGHRSDVRCVAWSSDNTCLVTGSSESIKIWNRSSLTCVRTISSGYALTIMFCPGDRHVILGTKSGNLEIFDLGSGEMVESINAHGQDSVWGLAMTSDKRGFISGGGDKTVKWWEWKLTSSGQLSAAHTRTLSVDESVTGVCASADGRLVAVALIDTTVKVFFVDTLKMFLSLYGHKLPVTSLDISDDSSLIATASADRNMKIWGLDFGDCHKSIFCHDDTVTGVRWMPETHRVVTSGKDGEVKMWDCDTFVRIQTLTPGHSGEVWAVAVSPNGKWVVSCGKDRSVRLWEKTQEILVLEDERETEREEAAEDEAGDRAAVAGEGEVALTSRRTAETERGAEMLMEALELYKTHTSSGDTQLPAMMLAFGAESALDYMVTIISRIKSAQLEEVLLVLPLDVVHDLVLVIESILAQGKEIEISVRCLLFVLEIHHGPIMGSKALEEVLTRLHKLVKNEVTNLKDMIGTNLAGLRYLSDRIEERSGVEMFTDTTLRQRERNKKKKKKEKQLQRAVMSL